LKLNPRKSIIRLIPGPRGRVIQEYRGHKFYTGNRFFSALDFDWLFDPDNAEIAAEVMKRNRLLSEKDREAWQVHGNPFHTLAREYLKLYGEAGKERVKKAGLWSSSRYLMYALKRDDEGVKIYDASYGFFESVSELMFGTHDDDGAVIIEPEFPNLLDTENGNDLLIVGNGKKKGRQYKDPRPNRKSTPARIPDDAEFIDFYDVLAARAATFEEQVQWLLATEGKMANEAGITYATFEGFVHTRAAATELDDEDEDLFE